MGACVSGNKRLYRRPDDALLAGVLSGLAQYLGVDKTVVRVLFVAGVVFTGFVPLVLVYVAMWAIVPVAPAPPQPAAAPQA